VSYGYHTLEGYLLQVSAARTQHRGQRGQSGQLYFLILVVHAMHEAQIRATAPLFERLLALDCGLRLLMGVNTLEQLLKLGLAAEHYSMQLNN